MHKNLFQADRMPGNAVQTGKLGYLLNFGEALMKDGITRVMTENSNKVNLCDLGAFV